MNLYIFLLLFLFPQEPDTLSTVEKIFQRIAEENRKTHTVSYQSSYTQFRPYTIDSIFHVTAKIWLELVSTDTIFGYRFHALGEDPRDTYDYYYDGQMSYEIRHTNKLVTIFNPFAFPNNANNPAKARTALLPFNFNSLLVDTNLSYTLLKHNPRITLKDSVEGITIIRLEYPLNEYDQLLIRTIVIDTVNLIIKKIEARSLWRGSESIETVNIPDYKRNIPSELLNISLTSQFEGYTKKLITSRDTTPAPKSKLIGKKAPDFSASLFSGGKFRLNTMKGKIVLLDFWETWCGYCLLAFPDVNKLYVKYKDKGVEVVGVTSMNRSLIERLIQENKLLYKNVFVNSKNLPKYNFLQRPMYVLIDRNGQIVELTYGDLDTIEDSIKKMIN